MPYKPTIGCNMTIRYNLLSQEYDNTTIHNFIPILRVKVRTTLSLKRNAP